MNIIYYMPAFLKAQAKNTNDKNLRDFCELFKVVSPNACLIDRANALSTPFNTEVLFKLPTKPTYINYTYNDLCMQRAEEILKNNKSVIVFYSGGIDSTVVLLSLWIAIKSGIGTFDQVTVAASPHSIVENPIFWNNYVLPYFNIISANKGLSSISTMSEIADRYVMGENADQLFGSDIILRNMDFFNQKISTDNIENFISSQGVLPDSKDYIHDVFKKLHANCPVELSNMADVIWWLNFSCKWQSVSLRTWCFTDFLDSHSTLNDISKFETFFNTEKFQVLSLYGKLKKWGDNPTTYNYKLASREFMAQQPDLLEFSRTKIKIPSLYKVLATTETKYFALGIENNNIIKLDKIETF